MMATRAANTGLAESRQREHTRGLRNGKPQASVITNGAGRTRWKFCSDATPCRRRGRGRMGEDEMG